MEEPTAAPQIPPSRSTAAGDDDLILIRPPVPEQDMDLDTGGRNTFHQLRNDLDGGQALRTQKGLVHADADFTGEFLLDFNIGGLDVEQACGGPDNGVDVTARHEGNHLDLDEEPVHGIRGPASINAKICPVASSTAPFALSRSSHTLMRSTCSWTNSRPQPASRTGGRYWSPGAAPFGRSEYPPAHRRW